MKPATQSAHVQWHEGMLLSPQHFQQEAGRLDRQIAALSLLRSPNAWGIASIEFAEGMLAAQVLEVQRLEAILPDGTAVNWPNGLDRPLRIDLKSFADRIEQGPCPVFLALALRRGLPQGERYGRFEPLIDAPVEDEVSSAEPLDVPRLAYSLHLFAGDLPPSSFTCFQLATVTSEGGVMKLGGFVPPLLRIDAAPHLFDRIKGLAAQIRSRAHFLARLASAQTDPARSSERQAHQQRLHCLVRGLPLLEHLTQSPDSDAGLAFRTLCTLIAPLSELRSAQLPEPPPPLDHSNPGVGFGALLDRLEEAVSEISQDYREVKFEPTAGGFQLKLRPEWITSRLVIGIQGPVLETASDWLETAVIGVEALMPDLRARRVLGLRRHRISAAEELGLKPLPNVAFFELLPAEGMMTADSPLVIEPSGRLGLSAKPSQVVLFVAGLLKDAG
jgi:type VI secretion system protein ImpJ